MNIHSEEINEFEQVRTTNKILHVILYAKHAKADLNRVMKINANI